MNFAVPYSRLHVRLAHACAIAVVAALTFVGSSMVPGVAFAAPPNDDFSAAQDLVGDDPFAIAHTMMATRETNEPLTYWGSSCTVSSETRTVWYRWTPATSHLVRRDSQFALWEGSSISTLTALQPVPPTQDVARVLAGQTYMVQVRVCIPADRMVSLPRLTMLADAFEDAPISDVIGYNLAVGWIDDATRQVGEPLHAGVATGAKTVWRRITSSTARSVVIDTTGSQFDTVLAVYTGSGVGSLIEAASNDDESATVTTSKVTLAMQAGQVYRVAISDKSGTGTGKAVLNVNNVAAAGSNTADTYATRTQDFLSLGSDYSSWTGLWSVGAGSVEPGEPPTIGGATDTWWGSVTPAQSGTMPVALKRYSDVGTCTGTDYDVEVFTGGTLGTLVPVHTRLIGSPLTFELAVTGGVQYTFRISGVVAPPTCTRTQPGIYVTMSDAVFPDAFADAVDISSPVAQETFGNYNFGGAYGSVEVGEPAYTDGTDRTAWYTFTLSQTQIVEFGFDGLGRSSVHVYTGTGLGDLTEVASSTSPPYDGYYWSSGEVSFLATAGQRYYVAHGGIGPVAYPEIWSYLYDPAPANDNFANAVVLTQPSSSSSGAAATATRETGEPAHSSNGSKRSVWYSWTAPVSRSVRVDLAGSVFTGSLAVYTGSSVGALTLVDRDDGVGAGTNQVVFSATAGVTYSIAVSATEFRLNVDVSAAHDKFSSALALTGSSGRRSDANFGAVRESGEPTHAGNGTQGGSMWYRWTAVASGPVTLDTSGSAADTVLGVYTGSSVGDLVGVGANDDSVLGGTHSRLTFAAVAGTTYRIAVETKGATRGSYVLRWRAPEGNDLQGAAATIPAAGGTVAGSVLGGGTEWGEPSPCPVTACDATVWYEWTPAFSGIAGIRVPSTSFDTVLAAYTGPPGSLVLVTSNDDYAGSTSSRLRFAVTSGTTYRIQMASKAASSSGTFTLDVNVAPANDNFAGAVTVSGATGSWSGHNFGATSEGGEPTHAAIAGGRSVWVKWVATATGPTWMDTQGSEIDTLLGVYTGASVGALTEIASDDDALAPASRVAFAATSGTTYWIAVDGKAGDVGNISLRIGLPTNDMIASATPITDSGFMPIAGTTTGSTWELGEPNFMHGTYVGSVWYAWTTTTAGSRTLEAANGSVKLEIFTGPVFASLTPVPSMVQSYPGDRLVGRLPAGTYWVRATSTGHNFTLTSPPSPPNDDVANAQVITGTTGSWAGDDSGAGGEVFENDFSYRDSRGGIGSMSTWFSWTAPVTGPQTFLVTGDRTLSVWADDPGDRANMKRVDVEYPNSGTTIKSFPAQAGTTYLVRIAGYDDGGTYTLTLNPTPANDDFASAMVFANTTADIAWGVQSEGATCESGEPDHAGVACAASTWYAWTPSASGAARFTTVGSHFNTTIAVYTGSAVNALTEVASSAGPHPAYSKAAQVDTAVVAGTTYYIAVAARSGHVGRVYVQAGMTPSGDDFASPIVAVGDSVIVTGTTLGATMEGAPVEDTSGCGSSTKPADYLYSSVWVQWTPSYTGFARITPNISFGGWLFVFDTSPFAGGWYKNLSGYDDARLGDIPNTGAAIRGMPVQAGRTYWFRVQDDYCYNDHEWGAFTIEINQVANDAFASAETFGATSSRRVINTGAGSTESGEPDHGGASDPRSYWWNWTAPTSGPVSFTTAGSRVDTSLGVYTGAAVNALTLVTQADDTDGDDATVQFVAAVGTTYRIAVGAAGSQVDLLALRRDAPTNDTAAGATLLTGPSTSTTTRIANGTYDDAERQLLDEYGYGATPWHLISLNESYVWYRWVAPESRPVELRMSAREQSLFVFEGAAVGSMVRVAKSSQTASYSVLRFTATAGQTYRIATGGYYLYTSGGSYTRSKVDNGLVAGEGDDGILTLVQQPGNDDLAGAVALGGWTATATVNTGLATREVGEPDHGAAGGASVWFEWTAPSSGKASISTAGSDFDTLIGVYTGSTIGTLQPVTRNDDYPVTTRAVATFAAVAGTTYRIAVDGFRAATGNVVVGVNVRPPNDDLVNAFVIDGDVARTSGYSINSTLEGSEPNHGGLATTTSVWWSWTPAISQTITMDTFGSNFDTVLAVYTGATVGTLVPVAANDDAGTEMQSSVTFAATAGTTYRIAVAGVSSVGDVRLRVNPRMPLVPDLVAPIGGGGTASRSGALRARVHHEDIAVLAGIEVEVCADPVAPGAPWSVNCTSGYQTAVGPTLLSDGSIQDVMLPARMNAHATYHWHARTIDDAGRASAFSASDTFQVGTSLSMSTSWLGYDDTGRDVGVGASFGAMMPGTTTSIGPIASGQRTPGAALSVSTTSDYATQLLMSGTSLERDGGGGSIPLEWRDHDSTGQNMQQTTWTAVPAALTLTETSATDNNTYAYDLQAVVAPGTMAGDYAGSMTITLVAAP